MMIVRYLCHYCLHEWDTENFLDMCNNCGELGYMISSKPQGKNPLGSTEDEQHSK